MYAAWWRAQQRPCLARRARRYATLETHHERTSTPRPIERSVLLGELAQDFVVLGESSALELVPDVLAVHAHRELAGLTGHKLDDDAIVAFDGRRETRSGRLVVSLHAVVNLDLHFAISFRSSISSALGTTMISQRRFFCLPSSVSCCRRSGSVSAKPAALQRVERERPLVGMDEVEQDLTRAHQRQPPVVEEDAAFELDVVRVARHLVVALSQSPASPLMIPATLLRARPSHRT